MRRVLLKLSWLFIRPLLFLLPAETAHRLTMRVLSAAPNVHGFIVRVLGGPIRSTGPIQVGPITLQGPVGLAAGLDKDGEAIEFWPSLGFGFVEVGTVTSHGQNGNPQPRLFRLIEEEALINRMGFNNDGSEALAERLKVLRQNDRWPAVPVGANIGKSKVTPLDQANEDYLKSVACLKELVDYFTVNVSSPNTPGLRDLQQADALRSLLEAVVPAAAPIPVFVKFSPDLDDEGLDAAVEVAVHANCVGIIATNTTRTRPGSTGRTNEVGGMSGAPLWSLSRERIGRILRQANGRIPVIGAGGVRSWEQAAQLLDDGCVAVQVYSGLVFEGPAMIHAINDGLADRV